MNWQGVERWFWRLVWVAGAGLNTLMVLFDFAQFWYTGEWSWLVLGLILLILGGSNLVATFDSTWRR